MVNALCLEPVVLASGQILRGKMINSSVERALGKDSLQRPSLYCAFQFYKACSCTSFHLICVTRKVQHKV